LPFNMPSEGLAGCHAPPDGFGGGVTVDAPASLYTEGAL
jgi:hypothetical protein